MVKSKLSKKSAGRLVSRVKKILEDKKTVSPLENMVVEVKVPEIKEIEAKGAEVWATENIKYFTSFEDEGLNTKIDYGLTKFEDGDIKVAVPVINIYKTDNEYVAEFGAKVVDPPENWNPKIPEPGKIYKTELPEDRGIFKEPPYKMKEDLRGNLRKTAEGRGMFDKRQNTH